MNDNANESNPAGNYRINNRKATSTKSFKYKGKIRGSTPADGNVLVPEVNVPLKYLNNFWRSLDLPLINCEIELDLSLSNSCVVTEISRHPEIPANTAANPPTDC